MLVLESYVTRSGDIGVQLVEHTTPAGKKSYALYGKWDASSGGTLVENRKKIAGLLKSKRGWKKL